MSDRLIVINKREIKEIGNAGEIYASRKEVNNVVDSGGAGEAGNPDILFKIL